MESDSSLLLVTSPISIVLALVGVALLVWAPVDLWRRDGYTRASKVGWQLAIAGLVLAPLVAVRQGWFIGFPLGAVIYLLGARHGPLRRRIAS